ncbi:MAG TPA: type II toxin-antitoxin system RelE/ParE family toxin [Alicyclobacillus sp.]|nr:type II toxin-antitoxin system RelE/ParE family toxin [Alicyclobacillus sp.]
MIVRVTHRFTKSLAKLDPKSRKAVKKAMELLLENPHHPSLRTRKMKGYEGVFEVSASMDIRITFHYEKPDTIVLRNVGHHDDALSNP